MTVNTTNMGLGKGEGTDNSATYLKTTLAAALDALDAHRHGGGTDGLPVIALRSGLDAAKPAAGAADKVYYSTDLEKLYIDTGAAWAEIPTGNLGVITAMLAANVLSADATGLGKMQDGYLAASAAGRLKMADSFLTNAKLATGTQGGVKYAGAAGVWADLAVGTTGQFLQTKGAAADPVWASVTIWSIIASDNLKNSSDVAKYTTSGVYVKIKETALTLPSSLVSGTLRVKFQSLGGVNATTRIYRNGAAIGTERSGNATWSEDFSISAWATGDLLQIYAHSDGVDSIGADSFRLYYDIGILTTNQDP